MNIDVIRLARDAGMFTHKEVQPEIERFAAFVMEECAKVCDDVSLQAMTSWKLAYQLQDQGREMGAEDCAAAIRARKP